MKNKMKWTREKCQSVIKLVLAEVFSDQYCFIPVLTFYNWQVDRECWFINKMNKLWVHIHIKVGTIYTHNSALTLFPCNDRSMFRGWEYRIRRIAAPTPCLCLYVVDDDPNPNFCLVFGDISTLSAMTVFAIDIINMDRNGRTKYCLPMPPPLMLPRRRWW